DAPRLQHAIGVAVLAGAADVVHQLVTPPFLDRRADASADVVQGVFPAAALAAPLQRIEDAIGVFELIRGDDPLGAGAAAAARVHRVAFHLADVELFLVHVGEEAARRLAVEADRRDDPVVPPLLLGPGRRLVVGEVVPLGGVGMRSEAALLVTHDRSTQRYRLARL